MVIVGIWNEIFIHKKNDGNWNYQLHRWNSFFSIKRSLLKFAGIPAGPGTKVVGPIFIGNASKLSIGQNVWLGRGFSLDGNGEVVIGNNIDIAPCVSFGTGGHVIASSDHRAGEGVATKIVIEDGSWICQNVIVVNNVTVHSGSVVAAGAVVTADVPCNSLVAGVPASIKKRLAE